MSRDAKEIHILCEELLPFYEELGNEAKEIIDQHVEQCSSCSEKSKEYHDLNLLLTKESNDHINTEETFRKFTKLHRVKNFAIFAIVLFKAVVLTLIGKEFMVLATATEAPLGLLDEGVRISMLLYYMPLAFVALVLSIILIKKRFAITIFIFDILLFIYFDDLLVEWVS